MNPSLICPHPPTSHTAPLGDTLQVVIRIYTPTPGAPNLTPTPTLGPPILTPTLYHFGITLHIGHLPLKKVIHKTLPCVHITHRYWIISLHIVYVPADWSVGCGRQEQAECWFLYTYLLVHDTGQMCGVEVKPIFN